MQRGKPSQTALVTTFIRALHQSIDDHPLILDDPIALQLLPRHQQRFIRLRERRKSRWFRAVTPLSAMRGQIVVRARYAEDCLALARHQVDATRLIVLGAGLDTFALRQPEPPIDVIEIDHPLTQQWKKQLLNTQHISMPSSLSLIPLNFETTDLRDAWTDNPAPDFVSWLGTTYYLNQQAISHTLKALADRTAPKSQLVLDYWSRKPRGFDVPLMWGTQIAVTLQGEPLRSLFTPVEMERIAEQAGWTVAENLDAAMQTQRYLAHRRDGLAVPSFAHLLRLER